MGKGCSDNTEPDLPEGTQSGTSTGSSGTTTGGQTDTVTTEAIGCRMAWTQDESGGRRMSLHRQR